MIRVIAPSRSLSIVAPDQIERARRRLEQLDFSVTFGTSVYERGMFDVVPLQGRERDLGEAVSDESVDIIMSAIGGYSSAELIPMIDNLSLHDCNSTFVGNSDVTVILNYLHIMHGRRAICGPHFSSFGTFFPQPYLEDAFLSSLDDPDPRYIQSPLRVGGEFWHLERGRWETEENVGPLVVNAGRGTGRAIGGNLPTLIGRLGKLLAPDDRLVIMLEIHSGYEFLDYIKWIHSIVYEIGLERIEGICIGKMPIDWRRDRQKLAYLVEALKKFSPTPTVVEADFGHNMPFFSFEIGREVTIDTSMPNPLLVCRRTS